MHLCTACSWHTAHAHGTSASDAFAAQVASIYDVAVHPALQQQGIGQHMLQLLVHQLKMQGIYDIGEVIGAQSVATLPVTTSNAVVFLCCSHYACSPVLAPMQA